MKLLASLRSIAVQSFHRSQINNETEQELFAHIQHRADDLERSGLTRAEAERRARIEFGSYEKFRQESHEALGGNFIETSAQDVRYSLRRLRKPPNSGLLRLMFISLQT